MIIAAIIVLSLLIVVGTAYFVYFISRVIREVTEIANTFEGDR